MEDVLIHNTARKTRQKLRMTKAELARIAFLLRLAIQYLKNLAAFYHPNKS
jgi:hypothetical protein